MLVEQNFKYAMELSGWYQRWNQNDINIAQNSNCRSMKCTSEWNSQQTVSNTRTQKNATKQWVVKET